MNHDIYIKQKSGGTQIRIPWLPSEIAYESGGSLLGTYSMLDLGDVVRRTGAGLSKVSWSGTFPGAARNALSLMRGKWVSPQTYQSYLNKWKKSGTTLNLLITGTPVNMDVYLEDFKVNYSGGFGDYSYDVSFVELKTLSITTIKKAVKKKTKSKSRSSKTYRTYTVKRGDCLWNIAAKRLGRGSRWKEIYKLNKSTIEKAAKKRGRRSSSNGHWIYPGTKLKLPKK